MQNRKRRLQLGLGEVELLSSLISPQKRNKSYEARTSLFLAPPCFTSERLRLRENSHALTLVDELKALIISAMSSGTSFFIDGGLALSVAGQQLNWCARGKPAFGGLKKFVSYFDDIFVLNHTNPTCVYIALVNPPEISTLPTLTPSVVSFLPFALKDVSIPFPEFFTPSEIEDIFSIEKPRKDEKKELKQRAAENRKEKERDETQENGEQLKETDGKENEEKQELNKNEEPNNQEMDTIVTPEQIIALLTDKLSLEKLLAFDTNGRPVFFTGDQPISVDMEQSDSEILDIQKAQDDYDFQTFLGVLPKHYAQVIRDYKDSHKLVEVVLDLGRLPEARFSDGPTITLADTPVGRSDLHFITGDNDDSSSSEEGHKKVGKFGEDNRAGIDSTLHRISQSVNRKGERIGLTCRVGQAAYGASDIIADVVNPDLNPASLLILGKPGSGKTTLLRDICRVLADKHHKRVVVVDTSNEVGGDGDLPHPGIGSARRLQVSTRELQHHVMVEAVCNHTPEVIVVDEITNLDEAQAAQTIAQRGIRIIATAHGGFTNVLKNPILAALFGGIETVTYGDAHAKRTTAGKKTQLERVGAPTFGTCVQVVSPNHIEIYKSTECCVDELLALHPCIAQVRKKKGKEKIVVSHKVVGYNT